MVSSHPHSQTRLVAGLVWLTYPDKPSETISLHTPTSLSCSHGFHPCRRHLSNLSRESQKCENPDSFTFHNPSPPSTGGKAHNARSGLCLCPSAGNCETPALGVAPAQVTFLWHLRNMGNASWCFSHIEKINNPKILFEHWFDNRTKWTMSLPQPLWWIGFLNWKVNYGPFI